LVIHFPASYALNMPLSLVPTCHGGVPDKMLDVLMLIFWFLLGIYSFWFVTRAKRSQPMTLDELVMLWKIHKQQTRCNTPLSSVNPIIDPRSNEFSGFRCDCGYQYQSKRLIVQRHTFDHNMFSGRPLNKGKQSSILKT
jgi:hypothetical protein